MAHRKFPRMDPADRAVIVAIAIAAAACVGSALIAARANAHEAPSGWSYPASCCSNRDCRQDDSAARPVDQGWLVRQTGEVIGWNDARIKHSPDGLTHICMAGADFTSADARVLCLFVPPFGF